MGVIKDIKSRAISLIAVVAVVFTVLMVSASSVFATQAHDFSFRVQPRQQNAQEPHGRWRGNVAPSDRWWVKLIKSGEGKGAATDFWIESANGVHLSHYMRVRCGKGWYGKEAFSSASNRRVYLTAEDNEYKSTGYNISGRWQTQDD